MSGSPLDRIAASDKVLLADLAIEDIDDARAGLPGGAGFVVVTSRLSVEMVQKTAAIGAPLLVAISAPTALAIRAAEAAGVTLAAVARADGFEIFTHARRIRCEETDVRDHVA